MKRINLVAVLVFALTVASMLGKLTTFGFSNGHF